MRTVPSLALAALLAGCALEPVDPVATSASLEEATTFLSLPAPLRRRALRLHHERASSEGSAWRGTVAGDPVRPLYRPDLDGVAFWEIAVRTQEGEPAGAIILSTAEHDAPLAEIVASGPTPSELLERSAEGRLARVYRLGSGSFVAEDEGGRQVARLGDAGYRIDRDAEAAGRGSIHFGSGREDDWSIGPQESHTRWVGYGGDWEAEKRAFAEDQHERLRATAVSAAPLWETLRVAEREGEGLVSGLHVLPVPASADEVRLEITGDGARFVEARVEADGRRAAVILDVRGPEREAAAFTVHLSYAGQDEDLPFFGLGNGLLVTTDLGSAGIPFPPYVEWLMDRPHNDEWTPSYSQIPDTYRLGMRCNSGCGPTAWTILTAHYDRSAWWGSGFVRQGASENGPDVLAPYTWATPQVGADDVREMMRDLGGASWDRFGTTCNHWGGESYTFPYRMQHMDDYLRDRAGFLPDPPNPGDPRLDVEMWWSDDILGKDWITDGTVTQFLGSLQPRVVGYLYHYAVLEGYSENYTIIPTGNGNFTQKKTGSKFMVNYGWDWDGGDGKRKASGWISETLWYSAEIEFTPRHPVNGCDGKKGNEYRCCVWPRKPGCFFDEDSDFVP